MFDDSAVKLIHELTEGVPRRINVFCDRILLYGYLEEVIFFTEEHIQIVADELADEITSPLKLPDKIETSDLAGSASDGNTAQASNIHNHISPTEAQILPLNVAYEQSRKNGSVQSDVKATQNEPRKENVNAPIVTETVNAKAVNSKTSQFQPVEIKSVSVNPSITSDFVDIDETIRDFESRVEKEIESFKKSLDKKF